MKACNEYIRKCLSVLDLALLRLLERAVTAEEIQDKLAEEVAFALRYGKDPAIYRQNDRFARLLISVGRYRDIVCDSCLKFPDGCPCGLHAYQCEYHRQGVVGTKLSGS